MTMMVMSRLLMIVMAMVTAGLGEELRDSLKEQQLRELLLGGYDKETRPASPTIVNLTELTIRDVEMHEGIHRVNVLAWLHLEWYDKRLSWKADDYPGLDHMSFPSRQMWIPDLSVYNAYDAETTLLTSRFRCVVYPNGKIIYVPSINLHYTCVLDLTFWPHDTHNCSLKLGSWVHDANKVDLAVGPNMSAVVEATLSEDGMQWEMKSSSIIRESKFYDCCPEAYVNLLAIVVLKRIAPAYDWVVKTPAICLSLLTLVLFMLPPGAGEKITFGGICLILNLMFIVYSYGTISSAPTHTPLIVQLVVTQLVLAATSVLVSAAVIRAARGPHSTPPSPGAHNFALSLAPCLGLSSYVKKDGEGRRNEATGQGRLGSGSPKSDEVELGSEVDGGRGSEQGQAAAQWHLLAAVLNRLSLCIYFAIIIVVLIRFTCVL